jgi:alkanesulfonate monooxygenase SsuD/methylene tetrahydromethanopterin reductase-like flavin-dependent oxidoreductase (luciferase family)
MTAVRLRFGLYVPTWPARGGESPRWPEIRALAQDAEALGVHTLWVADEPGYWECWTLLTAVASATSTVEVGPLVACTRYRHPGILAAMVRALDEVSGCRVILGLGSGVGPTDPRWATFGWDGSRHVSRFAEAVQIVSSLLRDGPIAFEGEFYRVAEPNIGPVGPRPGGPPIWVAAGKARTFEVAARFGDAVNFAPGLTDAASVERLRIELDAACDAVSRTRPLSLTGWARIAPSSDGRVDEAREDTISGTPEAVAERLWELHAAGIEHLTCFVSDGTNDHPYPRLTASTLAAFATVIDKFRAS